MKVNKLNLLRLIAAIVAATFVGSLIIYAFQALGQITIPPPFEYNPADPGIFRKLTSAGQLRVLLPVLVSYIAGSLVAGFLAGIISRGKSLTATILTGVVLLSFGLVNLLNFYHPVWFWIAAIAAWLLMAVAGGLMASRVKKN